MYAYRFAILIGFCSLSLWGVTLAMHPPKDKTDPSALKAFAQTTNQFGYDLFQQLRKQPGNLFFSP